MKLSFLEVSGFRGFRDKLRIEFGPGFTVISGRNGVGKSTLCDAVEFALTGSINKYKVEKSAFETLRDYIWWRGAGSPKSHYVTVSFQQDDGQQYKVVRTREDGCNRTPNEIEDNLCLSSRPENALHQLCKTSIIRDEWISELSVELSEIERFELVRSALGVLEGSELATKAKQVIASAKTTYDEKEKVYDAVHTQLSDSLSQLSEAKDAASRSGDVKSALQLVAAIAPDATAETLALIAAGRAVLVDERTKLAQADEVIKGARELKLLRYEFNLPEETQRREAARIALANATAAKVEAELAIEKAELALSLEEQKNAVAVSLAQLVEHGKRLGLYEMHCPLCAANRTSRDFELGIAKAQDRIDSLASAVSNAHQALVAARAMAERPMADFASAENEWMAINQQEARLIDLEKVLVDQIQRSGLEPNLLPFPEKLEILVAEKRDRLINLERALLTLEASKAISRTIGLEERVTALRREVDLAAKVMDQSRAAIMDARAIEHAVKRVNAEIIEERLAQISPLLKELYQRLRPHADWREIDYRIRGDVRRFLSLRVGNGLNPQFVLSSGQRRAVGLAFLLSVHLARAWTSWRTLVLDDPVQHIDDFRALHFVEILAALRHDDRQIICTVEDNALAELLCRRLSSTTEHMGNRYDIYLDPEGVAVVDKVTIPPLPVGVLLQSPTDLIAS